MGSGSKSVRLAESAAGFTFVIVTVRDGGSPYYLQECFVMRNGESIKVEFGNETTGITVSGASVSLDTSRNLHIRSVYGIR